MKFCPCCISPAGMSQVDGAGGHRRKRHAYRTIDIHCHVLTPEAEAAVAGTPGMLQWNERMTQLLGADTMAYMRAHFAEMAPKLTDLDVRLRDMDAMGVDVQVLSPSPTQYHYWADPELADRIVRLQNARIAEIRELHPDRFHGLGAIALQHPELAVQQLREGVTQYGLKGVEVSSSVNGMEFSDPRLEPVWACAAELGAIIFIHPIGSPIGARIQPFYLSNIVGQPIETTIALSHMIFAGVFDRHPNLKICAAHGGGYLASYIGRSDHGYKTRPECKDIAKPPSEYLRQMYFDTVVHSPTVLAGLARQVGLSQIVVGTDYPFDMGDYEIEALLHATPDLTSEGRAAIFGGNAERLLGI